MTMDPDKIPRPPASLFGAKKQRKDQFDELRELQLAQFEDNVVSYLLRRYRLNSVRRLMSDDADEHGKLKFESFADMFPRFSAHFNVQLVPHVVKKSPLHLFWNAFSDLPFMSAYEQTLGEAHERNDSKVACLVFSWPYLRISGHGPQGPGVVVHNGDAIPQVVGTRITHLDAEGRYVALEPLISFLTALDQSFGTGWKDDYADDSDEE